MHNVHTLLPILSLSLVLFNSHAPDVFNIVIVGILS